MPPAKPPPQSDARAVRLVALAERCYGDGWRAALATEMAVEPSTVWRWSSGNAPIPQAVFVALLYSATKRRPRDAIAPEELDAMIDAVLAREKR